MIPREKVDGSWAKAAAEFDEDNRQRREEYDGLAANGAAWREKWPNHCKSCGGWGGTSSYDNHGIPGPSEQIFDACDALPETQCHRCGKHAMIEDREGMWSCTACGWNWDDGDTTP